MTSSGRLEPVDDSDEALLVRTGEGERAAFAVLYDRFVPRVFGLVQKVVRDPSLSRDTTQEVLTELWRTAPRFDPGKGNAVSWILTLAHRRAVDTVRREQSARDRADAVGRREDAQRPFDDVSGRSPWPTNTHRFAGHWTRSPTCSDRRSSWPTSTG